MSSRHLSRMTALQALFTADSTGEITEATVSDALMRNRASLTHGKEDVTFTESLIRGVVAKISEIDAVIARVAPEWPVSKVAPIDRTVLRIGLYELLYGEQSVPPKVAVDEAIELGKEFGGDASGSFVSGVLGSVYREVAKTRGTP